ncbi:hypothetical protein JTE90_014899 [Oedothorax gibbosus]|uniref:Uncharacterized protein n=1 Tax=Oedothorax gibbosus TaxID=931172 RepID=A0AAV6VMH8_9ARAC|nr:hypothetical protein JTE90_014899 [Oedothorax gibbosus]
MLGHEIFTLGFWSRGPLETTTGVGYRATHHPPQSAFTYPRSPENPYQILEIKYIKNPGKGPGVDPILPPYLVVSDPVNLEYCSPDTRGRRHLRKTGYECARMEDLSHLHTMGFLKGTDTGKTSYI